MNEFESHKDRCAVERIRADLAEEAVENALIDILLEGKYFENLGSRVVLVAKEDIADLEYQKRHFMKLLSDVDQKIEQTFNLASSIKDGSAAQLIKGRLEKLAEEKAQYTPRLKEIKAKIEQEKTYKEKQERPSTAELTHQFWTGWKITSPNLQRNFYRHVIDKILVSENGLEVHYFSCQNRSDT